MDTTYIDRTITLDDVDAALERLEAGRTRGKITATIADRPGTTQGG